MLAAAGMQVMDLRCRGVAVAAVRSSCEGAMAVWRLRMRSAARTGGGRLVLDVGRAFQLSLRHQVRKANRFSVLYMILPER